MDNHLLGVVVPQVVFLARAPCAPEDIDLQCFLELASEVHSLGSLSQLVQSVLVKHNQVEVPVLLHLLGLLARDERRTDISLLESIDEEMALVLGL